MQGCMKIKRVCLLTMDRALKLSGAEMMSLAKNIRNTVKSEFLIELEIEPRVYGSL